MLIKFHHRSRFVFLPVLLLLASLVAACAAPSGEDQDKNWTGAEGLIETSDRIVVAQFRESRIESIPGSETVTGELAGESNVLFRKFEVIETIKGTTDAGDELWISFRPGIVGQLVDGQGAVAEFEQTATYVLFLKGRLKPLEFPPDVGAVLWTGNGEPAFALVVGDDLEFRAERSYIQLLREQGKTLPETFSAAPFTLSLTELRDRSK